MSDKPKPKPKPKPPEPAESLESVVEFQRRIDLVWNHLDQVRSAGRTLVTALVREGRFELARRLAKSINEHDASKFQGIQWDVLTMDKSHPDFFTAIKDHWATNTHHPEHFESEGIVAMNEVQLAELVVDWLARGREQGTDLRKWIKESAMEKFGFTSNSKVYRKIKYFVDLILADRM